MIGAFNQNIDSDRIPTDDGGRDRDRKFKRKQTGGKLLLWADGRTRTDADGPGRGKVICPTGALSQPTYIHLTMLIYLVHTQITPGRIYGRVVKIMKEIVLTKMKGMIRHV